MSFGGFERSQAPSQPMVDINVTPLVDVMLVLLVIFIITAPLLAYAIRLDLPDAKAPAVESKNEAIKISIDAEGRIYWDSDLVDEAALKQRLQEAAKKEPQPELHLRADKSTRYDTLARLMATASEAGLAKMGFVTEPEQAPTTKSANDQTAPAQGPNTGPQSNIAPATAPAKPRS